MHTQQLTQRSPASSRLSQAQVPPHPDLNRGGQLHLVSGQLGDLGWLINEAVKDPLVKLAALARVTRAQWEDGNFAMTTQLVAEIESESKKCVQRLRALGKLSQHAPSEIENVSLSVWETVDDCMTGLNQQGLLFPIELKFGDVPDAIVSDKGLIHLIFFHVFAASAISSAADGKQSLTMHLCGWRSEGANQWIFELSHPKAKNDTPSGEVDEQRLSKCAFHLSIAKTAVSRLGGEFGIQEHGGGDIAYWWTVPTATSLPANPVHNLAVKRK